MELLFDGVEACKVNSAATQISVVLDLIYTFFVELWEYSVRAGILNKIRNSRNLKNQT